MPLGEPVPTIVIPHGNCGQAGKPQPPQFVAGNSTFEAGQCVAEKGTAAAYPSRYQADMASSRRSCGLGSCVGGGAAVMACATSTPSANG